MAHIQLTQGMLAEIDDEDYVRVIAEGRWLAQKGYMGRTWYAGRDKRIGGRKKKRIMLHRFILKLEDSPHTTLIDHIDHNGLNNKKSNLRVVGHSMNAHTVDGLHSSNTSGVKGVYWSNQKQKWHAEIKWEGRKMHIGFFDNIEDAAAARKRKEELLWQTYTHTQSRW